MTATATLAPLDTLLPGEDAPLTYTAGRGPITKDEALGVSRRLARKEIALGRPNSKTVVPDELPDAQANRASSIYRLPPLPMAFAKARAEVEGLTMTAVFEAFLREYAAGAPVLPTEKTAI